VRESDVLKFIFTRLRGLEAKLAHVQCTKLLIIHNTKYCQSVLQNQSIVQSDVNTSNVVVVGIFSVDIFERAQLA